MEKSEGLEGSFRIERRIVGIPVGNTPLNRPVIITEGSLNITLHPILEEHSTEPTGAHAIQGFKNGDIVEETLLQREAMLLFTGCRIAPEHPSLFVTEHIIFRAEWAGLKEEARKLLAFLRPGWR